MERQGNLKTNSWKDKISPGKVQWASTHSGNPRSRQATLAWVTLQLSPHTNIFLVWSASSTATTPSESRFPFDKETLNCPKMKKGFF